MSMMQLSNNSERQNWEYFVGKCAGFYNDIQLTAEDIKALEDSDMPTFTINRITPAVEVMLFFLTASRPRWKAVGRDMSGFDSDIGVLHTAIQDYCWDLSDASQKYAKIVRDAVVKSKGIMHIYVDKNADRGAGEVMFDDIDPEDVFIDPESSDIFSRDAKFIIVAKNFGKEFLKHKLPEYEKEIEKASGNLLGLTSLAYWQSFDFYKLNKAVVTTGMPDEMVGYYEVYSKMQLPYVTFLQKTPPSPEELDAMQKNAANKLQEMEQEIKVRLLEIQQTLNQQLQNGEILQERAELEYRKEESALYQQLNEMQQKVNAEISSEVMKTVERTMPESEYNKLMQLPAIASTVVAGSEIKYYEPNILLECIVGDTLLYTSQLPYANYPIIPLPFIHIGNPYPISAIRYVIGKQEELNKAHQIMIHHANLMSNPGILARQGTIIDKEKAQGELSTPAGIVEYEGEVPPKERIPQPLNSAFYQIVEQSKTDIEYSLGISSYMMGMDKVINEPFRSTLAIDEFGTRRLRMYLQGVVEPWLRHVGRVFKEIAQKTYTANKIFRIVSPEAGNENNPASEYEINKPIFSNTGEIIGKYFDYASAKFDVVEVSGSVWPTNREAKEQKMFEYFQAGAVDRLAWLRHVEIEDKSGIMERMDERARLEQTVKQLQEEVKKLNGDNDTLRRQVIQSGILVEKVIGSQKIKEQVLETKAQQRNLRNKMQNDVNATTGKFANRAERAANEIDLLKKNAEMEASSENVEE